MDAMKRMIALFAAGLVVSATVALTAVAQDDKLPTVKAIMKKLHGGKTALKSKVAAQLKTADPNWEALQKATKEYEELGTALAKNDPPKGDKGSWDKLAGDFAKASKTLNTAATDKDKPGAEAAFKSLASGVSCKTCHTAHKGQ
jgi:hypothetical protein